MNPLLTFFNNESEREAVRSFLIKCMEEMAVERAFAGESVAGIKEANDLIGKAFDKLADAYGKVEEPITSNSR